MLLIALKHGELSLDHSGICIYTIGEVKRMDEDKMTLWNAVAKVPKDAQKPITGGRTAGMTDISPQWRLQVLTEQFGPCGIGWYYETAERWTNHDIVNNTESAHVRIKLYIIDGFGGWSMPIEGSGGSMLIASEKSGLYHSDEAWKMATTDAISVACKQLGIAADIYRGWPDGRPADLYPDEAQALRDCEDINALLAKWTEINKYLDKAGREALIPIYGTMKSKLS